MATATRLWTIDACQRLDAAVRELQQVMVSQAERLGDADPARLHAPAARAAGAGSALDALALLAARARPRTAGRRGAPRRASLPLGSGAVAGSAFPVSRELLRERLGFAAMSPNSIDAVADRDFVAETLFALTLLGTHLSRLAEDLILFGSGEFGFVRFGDAFSTGSSMMPQKRNPDVFEIARGSAARMLGDLTTVLATLKGLPSGYNKDLQDDKRPLFDAVDTMMLVVPAVAGALDEVTFDTARMRAAVSAGLMATDLADYLVDRGVTLSRRAQRGREAGARSGNRRRGTRCPAPSVVRFRAPERSAPTCSTRSSRSGQSLAAIFQAAPGRMPCAISWPPPRRRYPRRQAESISARLRAPWSRNTRSRQSSRTERRCAAHR